MSKKIIKKISLILLIALSISFVGLNGAKAASKKDIPKGSKLICKYDGNSKLEIYYKASSKTFSVYNYGATGDDLFSGQYYTLFSPMYDGAGGMSVYISSAADDDFLNEGKCPDKVLFDYDGINEICFENKNENFCEQNTDETFYEDGDYDEDPQKLSYSNQKILKEFKKSSLLAKMKNSSNDCEGLLSTDLINWIQKLFNVVKIIAPLLVLGLTIFEFTKAVISQDQDSLKKAGIIFVKRLIIMIVLFFLPTLINLLLKLIDINGGTCNIK